MSITPPRRIWLTGAGVGIGAAIAEVLLRNGMQLAASARSVEPLRALGKRYPEQLLLVPGNLIDSQQVREIGERITRAWGALDTLILNAGTCEYVDTQPFDASIIERLARTNLLASSYCIDVALPLLRSGHQPHLVGIASSATFLPLPQAEAHGASKAGMRDLFESLRIDLADEGIAVTLVSPGFIDPPRPQRNNLPMPLRWSAEKSAEHICEKLKQRPLEIAFPALFMSGLWPLTQRDQQPQPTVGKRRAHTTNHDKGQS
ncbi:SDR family NAD(P)-dependent oxidoreductase [Pseudomonas sp. FEN]|uniref:SDR family NAD(P)-dependent oxidoreductase n=1 Tax=Pseudomonas sp. FEN TaxID=2767468 RepID=UPI001749E747|nr:SDR family oxidoreductase [Pseudomonas sp. FEN]